MEANDNALECDNDRQIKECGELNNLIPRCAFSTVSILYYFYSNVIYSAHIFNTRHRQAMQYNIARCLRVFFNHISVVRFPILVNQYYILSNGKPQLHKPYVLWTLLCISLLVLYW